MMYCGKHLKPAVKLKVSESFEMKDLEREEDLDM